MSGNRLCYHSIFSFNLSMFLQSSTIWIPHASSSHHLSLWTSHRPRTGRRWIPWAGPACCCRSPGRPASTPRTGAWCRRSDRSWNVELNIFEFLNIFLSLKIYFKCGVSRILTCVVIKLQCLFDCCCSKQSEEVCLFLLNPSLHSLLPARGIVMESFLSSPALFYSPYFTIVGLNLLSVNYLFTFW